MIKAESGKKETVVIVNRETAVFVTRTKHVLVARARDPLRPAYDNPWTKG